MKTSTLSSNDPIKQEIRDACKDLILSNDQLQLVMERLLEEITKGLSKSGHDDAIVKCFTTYVQDLPNGTEKGHFLALDLGGTNFRVLLITLDGMSFDMKSKIYAIPQSLMLGTGTQLFDHIAQCLALFVKDLNLQDEVLPLGFTFSFPLSQHGLTKGYLVRWTKGFNCSGVIGEDVVALLEEAIRKRDDVKIDVCAILNDTTGTLMSCAWKNRNCRIGLIVGTGTNACYVEKTNNVECAIPGNYSKEKLHMLINTEWGAFGERGALDFIITEFDRSIDDNSINPGKQLFEKMISGMYMGEITRLVLEKLVNEGLIFGGKCSSDLKKRGKFFTKYVSEIENDPKGKYTNCRDILMELGQRNVSDQDCENVRYVCSIISRRAAHLASAGIATLLNKMGEERVTVGIDGSVYRFHPHFHDLMTAKISELTSRQVSVPNRKKNNSNPLFEPLNTQAIALVNPNLLNPENNRRKSLCSNISCIKIDVPSNSSTRSNASTSSKDTENISQSSSPLTQNVYCNSTLTMNLPDDTQNNQNITDKLCDELDNPVAEIETCLQSMKDLRLTEDCNTCDKTNNPMENNCGRSLLIPSRIPAKSKCLLLEALMSYVNSADNTVRVRACEGIMVLASLEDTTFAQMVAQSDLPSIITSRLENLFNAIPAHVDPNEIDVVDVTWGLDSPLWTKEKKFPGCRQVAAFYMWFDYCNQLIREASTDVADVLAKHVRINFFEKIVTPALADHQVILVTALITKCLKELASSTLCTEVSYWLVGHNRHPEIPNVCTSPVLYRLINNCYTDSDELTVETLKLFEEVIDKRNEHTLHCLALMYLTSRGYYDNTAADSAITSWSDEEDEREREKKSTLDLSYEQSHSRTLAPSNIHRIVNCFLSLVPRYLQTDPDINSYERCMVVLEKQYSTVLRDCFLMAWPLEAVTHDDSASSDSRPEADHGATRFYMGPFLTMLFDKVCNMSKQRYEINLQLTVVISRLTLLPHPYLHEFLLNPLLPLVPGTKSLFTCLQKVVKQLVNEIPKTAESKQKLKETRERLLDDCIHDVEKENTLLETVVVTEEFCKGLAAIAYVKYHHSM